HGNDQFAWGKRTEELGVGTAPIPREKVTVEKLASAVSQMLQPAMIETARKLGKQLQKENGARETAQYLHRFLKG
ncbi:glycosyltransferase, partial [Bacillus sp. RAR_GA_16]|nr:glycosyltransferase [Bacillus sp. RAR_GA_16]